MTFCFTLYTVELLAWISFALFALQLVPWVPEIECPGWPREVAILAELIKIAALPSQFGASPRFPLASEALKFAQRCEIAEARGWRFERW